ncbi:hypothetical protein BD770DRAFT_382595 [Pilaira anomala]|nr:hypothetical protein BD770DRAFT_382595 [Pilaira anomala]
MFALLAMLKTVADRYTHASVREFRKLKLYFIQPSGKAILEAIFYQLTLMMLFGRD